MTQQAIVAYVQNRTKNAPTNTMQAAFKSAISRTNQYI